MRVKIHLFAGEILQTLYLGAHENMQFGREEIEEINEAAADLGKLYFVFVERFGIDDRHVDALQVEERVQVLRWSPGDDRQYM